VSHGKYGLNRQDREVNQRETIRSMDVLPPRPALAFIPLAAANAELPRKRNRNLSSGGARRGLAMFIHWGPVSLKGTEISWSRANSNPQCPNTAQFPSPCTTTCTRRSIRRNSTPSSGSPRQGGRDEVHGADRKHCDGFFALDSKVDDYNIMHTPFKRDVCAEFAPRRPRRRDGHRLVLFADGLARPRLAGMRRTPSSSSAMQAEIGESCSATTADRRPSG